MARLTTYGFETTIDMTDGLAVTGVFANFRIHELDSLNVRSTSPTQIVAWAEWAEVRATLDGSGFADFDSRGFPTTGTITGITLRPSSGEGVILREISMAVADFVAFMASDDGDGLMKLLLAGDDLLTADRGPVRLHGHDGNDELISKGWTVWLYGDAGDDIIRGNGTINPRDGVVPAASMYGGAGDDTFHVASVRDRVFEYAGEGYDTVVSTLSFSLAGQELERIELIGNGRIGAAGNELDNVLIGNNSTNALSGKGGADRMEGRGGDDVYTVDNVNDQVIEEAGAGIDLVKAGVTWTLGANVENLWLLTTRQINAIGNELNNTIKGNDRPNVIIGMGGRDLMTGGGGTDRFDFRAVSDSAWSAYDRITDLEDGDVINLTLIDADTTTAGNQAFVLADAFTGVAGQLVLTYVASGDFTQLAADVDGDGAGDFRVILNGDHADYADFRL